MAKHLLNFKGLFGEDRKPFEQLSLHHEPLRTRSTLYNFEISEHLHSDLVQVFLITSGGGLLRSLGKKIPLEMPCVLIIPANVVHGFVFTSEVEGDVFTLSVLLYEKFIRNAPPLFPTFEQLQYLSFDLGSDSLLEILDLKNKIIEALQNLDKATSFELSLLFQLLLVKLYRSKKVNQSEVIETDDKTLRHFHNFKKIIKQHFHENRKVKFYAANMNLTTVHLNRICKAVAQKTALQIVHEHLLVEAKKYLKGTTYSIAEIAYFLDFKDPAQFSKFFKRLAGATPSDFRKNN